MSKILEIGANIATPLGAIGFLIAAALILQLRKLKHAENKLKLIPEDSRADAASDLLVQLKVHVDDAEPGDRVAILQETLRSRADIAKTRMRIAATVFVTSLALVLGAWIVEPTGPTVPAPSITSVAPTAQDGKLLLAVELRAQPGDATQSVVVQVSANEEWAPSATHQTTAVSWSSGPILVDASVLGITEGFVRIVILSANGSIIATSPTQQFKGIR